MDGKQGPVSKLKNSKQAREYLAKKWGIDQYSSTAFRSLCFRHPQIEPDLATGTATFWFPETLDRFPKPSKSNPCPKRRKRGGESADGQDSSDETRPPMIIVEGRAPTEGALLAS